jgi:hypothetical protein
VLAPYSVRYCGRGNVPACARSLWLAIKAGRADVVSQHGPNDSAWRIDQGMTSFTPGLISTTFPTTNRPTYQQVISLAPPRPVAPRPVAPRPVAPTSGRG